MKKLCIFVGLLTGLTTFSQAVNAGLAEDVKVLQKKVSDLETAVGTLEAKSGALENAVGTMQSAIASLKNGSGRGKLQCRFVHGTTGSRDLKGKLTIDPKPPQCAADELGMNFPQWPKVNGLADGEQLTSGPYQCGASTNIGPLVCGIICCKISAK